MPRLSRIGLRLPSQATMYRARITRSAAVVDVAHGRRYTFVVLLEVDQLGRVLEASPELVGPLQQERLEHLLGHEQAAGRADIFDTGVDVGDVVGDLPPGQVSRRR